MMRAIELADFDAPGGTNSPAHLRIADIVVRLPCPLEQEYGSLKLRLAELFTRPIRTIPPTVQSVPGLPVLKKQAFDKSLRSGKPYLPWKTAENLQSLSIIVHRPEDADLRVLQYPGVENCENTYLLVPGLEFENDLLRDHNALTHSSQAVRSVRLNGSHRGNAFLVNGRPCTSGADACTLYTD